jgi:DNA-binding beta-propeller fold protein YncE
MERPFVQLGLTRYRVERPFGDFRVGSALVSDVACNSRGHVFVLLRSDSQVDAPIDPVVELDPNGAMLRSFGKGEILDAHMLAIDAVDRVHVVDRDAHQIVVFGHDGMVCGVLGERGRPDRPFAHPSAVAFGPDGSVYVADGYAAHRVHRFSSEGALLQTWGTRGDGPGEFSTPHGIWALADGRVLVADRENDRVQVFSAAGEYLEEWRGFPRAMDIWSDSEGQIYITDQVPRLTRVDPGGRVTGCSRPVLNGAHGLWGDSAGRLYLAEVNPSRLTRLVPVAD